MERMVVDRHKGLGHIGAQTLWPHMREHFWDLKGRQLSRHVVRKCIRHQDMLNFSHSGQGE